MATIVNKSVGPTNNAFYVIGKLILLHHSLDHLADLQNRNRSLKNSRCCSTACSLGKLLLP